MLSVLWITKLVVQGEFGFMNWYFWDKEYNNVNVRDTLDTSNMISGHCVSLCDREKNHNCDWWPTRCSFFGLFIYLFPIGSTCFGRCFPPSSGALDCIYSFWYCPPIYMGEISPTSCNNCVFYSQWLYSTCFGWQSHPSSGVQCCIWLQVSWLT